jgi:hypothetical protein
MCDWYPCKSYLTSTYTVYPRERQELDGRVGGYVTPLHQGVIREYCNFHAGIAAMSFEVYRGDQGRDPKKRLDVDK